MRLFSKYIEKVIHKVQVYWNRLRFSLYNIEYGPHMIIHGHVGLSLSNNAKVKLGKNLYMSNGNHQNPLSGNDEGHIHVEENATLTIGDYVGISGTRIWCSERITIGNYVKIGGGVTIIDTDAHSLDFVNRRNKIMDQKLKKNSPIIIEDDVFIGMNSLILKGVTLGRGCVIGAGSVVTKSVPANSVACGNPAVVINNNK